MNDNEYATARLPREETSAARLGVRGYQSWQAFAHREYPYLSPERAEQALLEYMRASRPHNLLRDQAKTQERVAASEDARFAMMVAEQKRRRDALVKRRPR